MHKKVFEELVGHMSPHLTNHVSYLSYAWPLPETCRLLQQSLSSFKTLITSDVYMLLPVSLVSVIMTSEICFYRMQIKTGQLREQIVREIDNYRTLY